MTLVTVLDVLVGVIALALLAVGALAMRRRLLARPGGTFDCSLRLRTAEHGKGWVLGIARYAGDQLQWYRVFSFSMRPRRVLDRLRLEVLDRRTPIGAEAYSLLAGAVVVTCRAGDRPVELAMSPEALTGFLSWVESSPPGVRRA